MPNNWPDPPAADELEVSLFGPGYGEAIVLHIGNGRWIFVDSCLHPNSTKPASLQYLQDLEIDVEESVRLIVATHWHDDHVRGISTVLGECKSAAFAISGALNAQEFLKLVGLYSGRITLKNSGLDEFVQVFQILDARKQRGTRLNPPNFALCNRLLYREEISAAPTSVEAKVFSLSPSDASILQAGLSFAELMPGEGEPKKRIPSPSPNYSSVVLWVLVGNHKILLGADLERTHDSKTGWSTILDDSTAIDGKAGIFKVAHHGGKSGHEPRIWSELLSDDPFAILTPFRRGDKLLPAPSDVRRISGLTANAYITTAPRVQRRHRWTNKVVRELLKDAARDVRDVHSGWGQIRLRKRIHEESGSWQVALFGDAVALRN